MSETDRIIAELARDQFGVMHRRQLLARRIPPRQIAYRVDHGRLLDLGHGVLADPSHPATHLRQYKAAELAIPRAAIAGPAAAYLLGTDHRAAPAEIVVPPGGAHRCAFARVHRRTDVLVTTVRGIRTTTVPQTLVDLTARLRIDRVEAAWTAALIRDRTTLEELDERVLAAAAQHLGHRGRARAMLDLLVRGDERAESELEAELLAVTRSVPGIPAVVPQVPLPWWRGGRGRGDVGIPAWRLILEADGRSWHARLDDFDRDRARDNEAVANGFAVLRFSALHLRSEPGSVREIIERTGRHRAAA